MKTRAQITVTGLVQGVGFRWFVQKRATELSLSGFVKNLDDGNVYAEAEGEQDLIEALIEKIKKGPSFSRVKDVNVTWKDPENSLSDFSIAD
jgi:acylphosphatase